ncbi:hypothetical protein GQ457_09G005460 [Hibiscus cannabinus]
MYLAGTRLNHSAKAVRLESSYVFIKSDRIRSETQYFNFGPSWGRIESIKFQVRVGIRPIICHASLTSLTKDTKDVENFMEKDGEKTNADKKYEHKIGHGHDHDGLWSSHVEIRVFVTVQSDKPLKTEQKVVEKIHDDLKKIKQRRPI